MNRKEAIETVRHNWPDSNYSMLREALQTLIPELAESEDERIRKELWEYFRELELSSDRDFSPSFTIDDILAWLEKQKEQKPEHFELKAGKWYICHHPFCCRADHLTVKEGERFMCEKDGVVKGFVIKEPEKYFIECGAPAPIECEQKDQNKQSLWKKATAGTKFPSEALVISDSDPDPHLCMCAINDCEYILVKDIVKLK